MIGNRPRFTGAVWLTLLVSLALNMLPFAGWWAIWRPDWVALALIHWALVIRQDTSLFMAFFIGLMTDTLTDSLLGQHAFGYVLVTYLAVRLGLRMSPEAFLQQMALLFAVVGLYMLSNMWIKGVTDLEPASLTYWAPLLSSLIIWPIYQAIMSLFYIPDRII